MHRDFPLVTVIVPSYNHEKYIKEAIESIINQTYNNIELIVIDDGSRDNSVKIISELADKYDFIFIYRENRGLSSTLNEGIKISKGKYICICASDDIYISNKIEKQVQFMEKNPQYVMCHSNVIELYDNKIDGNNMKKFERYLDDLTFEDLLIENNIYAVSVMLRKSVFDIVGLFDEASYIEDWDMWLRIAYNKNKIGFINEFLAVYRIHGSNNSKNSDKMENAEKYILNKWSFHPLYKKVIINNTLKWFSYYSGFNKRKAIKYLPNVFPNIFKRNAIKSIFKLVIPSFILKIKRNVYNT